MNDLLQGFLQGDSAGGGSDRPACDFGPNALTTAFGREIPRTCIDVPDNDDATEFIQRCYYTHVPDCAKANSASKKNPLVLDLHGMGGCPLWHAGYSGWKEKADEECFVLVWPSGNSEEFMANCYNLPGFLRDNNENADDGEDGKGLGLTEDGETITTMPCCCLKGMSLPTKEPNDPLFLKLAVDNIIQSTTSLTIDADRVYMAGHSNGCMASLTMAALYSDTVAAVCCHAGAIVTPFAQDYSPVPIWLVHGTDDDTIPYNGAVYFPAFGNLGVWSVPDTTAYLQKQNQCASSATTAMEGGSVTTAECPDDATVEVVTLDNIGHFPFADLDWLGATPAPVDTTAMAWEFCSRHSKSGSAGTATVAAGENADSSGDNGAAQPDAPESSAGEAILPEEESNDDSFPESSARPAVQTCAWVLASLGVFAAASSSSW